MPRLSSDQRSPRALRLLPGARVARRYPLRWLRRDVPAGRAGAVVASAAFADEVAADLGDGYGMAYFGLRPEVVLALFLPR